MQPDQGLLMGLSHVGSFVTAAGPGEVLEPLAYLQTLIMQQLTGLKITQTNSISGEIYSVLNHF